MAGALIVAPRALRAGRRRLSPCAELAEAAAGHVLRAEGAAAATGRARGAGRGAPRARQRPAAGRAGRQRAAATQPGISGLAIDQAGSHLRVQPRPEAGDGVRRRRQPDHERRAIRRSTARRSIRRGSTRAPSTGKATSTSSSATPTASSSSVRSSTSSSCSSARPNERGNDATHFDLPSGIAVLQSGNIVVTDGYGNNRVVLFSKDGKFIKQIGKGAGGPQDKGTGDGEWVLPHKLARRCGREPVHHRPREPPRAGLRQEPDLHPPVRQRRLEPVGHRHLARKATTASRSSPTTPSSACTRFGSRTARSSRPGASRAWGPGEFDWVHGIVVDSQGRRLCGGYLRTAAAEVRPVRRHVAVGA